MTTLRELVDALTAAFVTGLVLVLGGLIAYPLLVFLGWVLK